MQRQTTSIAFLLALMVATAAGAGFRDFSSSSQSETFKHANDVRSFSKDISDTAGRISVRVKLKVKEGVVSWRLEDPYGTTVWQGRVEAGGKVEEKDWWNARAGEWRLILIFEDDATGRFGVKMSSR